MMNQRQPASPIYRRNGSGNKSGSYFNSLQSFNNSANSSFSYLDGDESGYHTSRAEEDLSMLYYKDKPVKNRSPLQVMKERVVKDPWRALGILTVVCSLIWGYRGRAQTSYLLRQLNVKDVNEALALLKIGGKMGPASADLRVLYEAQDKWEKRDQAWRYHTEKLQNHTQRESRRAVLDKYGDGPHHVQITVVLPHDQVPGKTHVYDESGTGDTFEVELAPLKDMPHSVHLFLEQVSHGLWNKGNLSFHVNSHHILLGGPVTKEARQHFIDYNIAHLAFPEYSSAFPHTKWTLGFAGRPGGPVFYINKEDNSIMHGPGGQEQHALSEFADSCFAKVVSGLSVLDMIIKETKGNQHTLILGMKIINWDGSKFTDTVDSHWERAHKEYDDSEDDDGFDDDFFGSGDDSDSGDESDDEKEKPGELEMTPRVIDPPPRKKKIPQRMVHNMPGRRYGAHGHHHHRQKIETILAQGAPKHVEPPTEIKVEMEELKKVLSEKKLVEM